MKSLNLFLILSLIVSNCFSQSLTWTSNDDGITLSDGDHTIYHYQRETKSLNGEYPRAHYLHPVYGLFGEIMTEDFPADHFHQRGIFWTWHQIIIENQPVADGWTCTGIEWKVQNTNTQVKDGVASLESKVEWICQPPSENSPVPCIEENSIIKYKSVGEAKIFDFEIILNALRPGTKIGGSEDVKGYGGFSARIWLPDDLKFSNRDGMVIPQNEPIEGGPWIDMQGTFDQTGKNKSGVTIMNHPDNPTPFGGWILRKKNSMQNAVFPGREAYPIHVGQPLLLNYRLIIHPPNWDTRQIESLYEDYIM